MIFPGQDKGVYELFPELRDEKAEDFLDFFVVDDLRELIVGCLDKFNKKLTDKDKKLCYTLYNRAAYMDWAYDIFFCEQFLFGEGICYQYRK